MKQPLISQRVLGDANGRVRLPCLSPRLLDTHLVAKIQYGKEHLEISFALDASDLLRIPTGCCGVLG